MVRHEQPFKERVVVRLLLPESGVPEMVAREFGIDTGTVLRWREEIESRVWVLDTRICAAEFHAGQLEQAPSRLGWRRL